MPQSHEVNFDAIVGPTHNYAGLSYGNLASAKHKLTTSHPRMAALQGLAKMKFMLDLGLRQAVFPPQDRPHLKMLRRLGFAGPDAKVLESAAKTAPVLLAACSSASAMWAANAATVSPSHDTSDSRVHFTPANLVSFLHRSIEAEQTSAVLRKIFADENFFVHHDPLPAAVQFSDEGAANHTRLGVSYDRPSLHVFTYGRSAFDTRSSNKSPRKFPARQTLEASQSIARAHGLHPDRVLFLPQNPKAIDAGVFHNDVVAVGNCDVLFCHEFAYPPGATNEIAKRFKKLTGQRLKIIEVKNKSVPLNDAVTSYLFNSQLVTLKNRGMALIAPAECRQVPSVKKYLTRLLSRPGPILEVHYVQVRESMQNGGGPACLRLRVVLTEGQILRAHPGVFLTDALYERLTQWVERHYRDDLNPADLADPQLLRESREALEELTRILKLGSIYDFQS